MLRIINQEALSDDLVEGSMCFSFISGQESAVMNSSTPAFQLLSPSKTIVDLFDRNQSITANNSAIIDLYKSQLNIERTSVGFCILKDLIAQDYSIVFIYNSKYISFVNCITKELDRRGIHYALS